MIDRGSIKLAGALVASCLLVVLIAASCAIARSQNFGVSPPTTDGAARSAGSNARIERSTYEVTHSSGARLNPAPRGDSSIPGQINLPIVASGEVRSENSRVGISASATPVSLVIPSGSERPDGQFERGPYVATGKTRRTEYRPHGGIPTTLILSAIAQVETGDNPRAIGRAGERGRHQLSAAAWKHSGVLLGCWCVRRPSARELLSRTDHNEIHAAAYLRFITSYLTTSGCEINPANVSAAWNLGPREFRRRGFSLHRCPPAVRDYARRVENLTK